VLTCVGYVVGAGVGADAGGIGDAIGAGVGGFGDVVSAGFGDGGDVVGAGVGAGVRPKHAPPFPSPSQRCS
jgi:hypothetical protein